MSRTKAFAVFAALTTVPACRVAEPEAVDASRTSWNATLRASHILPVAPCTEDLIPGDVFLVHESLPAQRKRWQTESCIVLGPHVTRLQSARYLDFYADAFIDQDTQSLRLPADWSLGNPAYADAPGAAFVSTNYKIQPGSAPQVAVPLTAISTGMDILRTQEATANVAMHAHSYGIDVVSLDKQVRAWAEDHRPWLAQWGPLAVRREVADSTETNPRYALQHTTLRVVARVFVSSRATVALQSTATPTNTTKPSKSKKPREIHQPGGGLHIRSVAPRSITMEERIEPPVTLGCLCIDMRIQEDGTLGPPVSTWTRLTDKDFAGSLRTRDAAKPVVSPPPQKIALR